MEEDMASLDMYGPYDFDENNVKKMKEEIGNYALGHMTSEDKFRPEYVGRSDTNIQAELLARLKSHGHHTKFKASITSSSRLAFEKECKNFHEFSPSENEIHPDKPNGSNLSCPYTQYHNS